MKKLSSKIQVINATHELRVRLQPHTKTTWDNLKKLVEKSTKQPYSDSAFFNHILNELVTPPVNNFMTLRNSLCIPVEPSK